ncbi:unnamed protein product [Heligmosomoides polygyrus]|uniref:Reverse transcriptase n=1 Tax=Heligmosomoides polygyrus TaxID=6339 RepID=A0A183G354_HELPZ|nr:unnamed protein product [Heligmosomoides polygyrus]
MDPPRSRDTKSVTFLFSGFTKKYDQLVGGRVGTRVINDTAGIISPWIHHTDLRSNRYREVATKFTTLHVDESRHQ